MKTLKRVFWEDQIWWKYSNKYFVWGESGENIKNVFFLKRELDENIQKRILEWVNFDENISKSYFGVGNQVPADMIVHFEGKQKLSVQLW